MKPSPLEEEYTKLYGGEFVKDLKAAYRWMKEEMKKQPPHEIVVHQRKQFQHTIGDWTSIFFVDFRGQNLYSQTIDEDGLKTVFNYGYSPILRAPDDNNVRYLLSGLLYYDKAKAHKWRHTLLGKGGKIWVQKV